VEVLAADLGGAFTVIPHTKVGKLPDTLPVFNGHGGAVLDTDFNPFNDYVVASASEDCKVDDINLGYGLDNSPRRID
jgi:coronin-1B/1C/6